MNKIVFIYPAILFRNMSYKNLYVFYIFVLFIVCVDNETLLLKKTRITFMKGLKHFAKPQSEPVRNYSIINQLHVLFILFVC